MLINRLKKNLRKINNWLKTKEANAFRLYDRDIPDIPYIIDIYDCFAVVYEKGKTNVPEELRLQNQENITQALQELFELKEVFFKLRKSNKGNEQYTKQTKWDERHLLHTVNENQALFEINLTDYLDTGLFLDHRPLRKIVRNKTQVQKCLNLFCYTGSISVMAALAGAQVTSVDLSNTYLKWAMRNFSLNQLNPGEHHFVKADILDYLDELKDKFDLIILDPPSFSNSKSMQKTLDIQRDHASLIKKCIKVLSPNGTLYFSTNKRGFKLDQEIEENYNVTDITKKSIPIDFRDAKIHQCFEIKN